MNVLAAITPALFTSRLTSGHCSATRATRRASVMSSATGGYPGLSDGGRVTRGPVDLGRTPADQLPGELPAESAAGAGDQGNRSGDLHGSPGNDAEDNPGEVRRLG